MERVGGVIMVNLRGGAATMEGFAAAAGAAAAPPPGAGMTVTF